MFTGPVLPTVCLVFAPCGFAAAVLQTNNPRKLDVLTQLGVNITGRIPCQVQAGEFNKVSRS